MKVIVTPFGKDVKNRYINRMLEAIKLACGDVEFIPLGKYKDIFRKRDADYVWLNWFENYYNGSKIVQLLKKVIWLLSFKLLRIPIVSTFHNRTPHDSQNTWAERLGFYLTFRLADKIIILSEESRDLVMKLIGNSHGAKVCLIPHPSYDCKAKDYPEKPDRFGLLFFGLLRPYKNIELVIEMATIFPQITFTIAGQPVSKDYETKLRNIVADYHNVKFIPHFLSESEIDNLIDQNTLLLLPYDLKSSLNSGVVIHGLSKNINMIIPEIGTVKQLDNKDAVFSYTYTSEEEHRHSLIQSIKQAYDLYCNDYNEFVARCVRLNKEVINEYSPEHISTRVGIIFE